MIIYDLQEEYKIKKPCHYLSVSTSGYYRWLKLGRPIRYSFDEWLADQIEKIFYETHKGYRFIRDELFRLYGVVYNDKTIYKCMKILGLSSPVRKKRYHCCTKEEPNEKARIVCSNLLARNFTASRPLEKLVTDVSYIYSQEGRMYLSVIKDLFDNSIIAYQVSKFNDLKLVMDNVVQVVDDKWNPTMTCTLHSDQGFQYTNIVYIKYLEVRGVTVSHSRKANCYDNACCENFFGHLKSEYLELGDYPKTYDDLIKAIADYIDFYNKRRPQRKLKGMTPEQFRSSYLSSRSFL
jgi:transposase InsO family protein